MSTIEIQRFATDLNSNAAPRTATVETGVAGAQLTSAELDGISGGTGELQVNFLGTGTIVVTPSEMGSTLVVKP